MINWIVTVVLTSLLPLEIVVISISSGDLSIILSWPLETTIISVFNLFLFFSFSGFASVFVLIDSSLCP